MAHLFVHDRIASPWNGCNKQVKRFPVFRRNTTGNSRDTGAGFTVTTSCASLSLITVINHRWNSVEMKGKCMLYYVSYSKQFIMTAQFKHYQLPDGLSEVVWPYHYQLCFVGWARCGNSSVRLSKGALRPLAQKPVPAIFLRYGIGHEIAFAFWTPPCVMWGGKYGPHLSVWSPAD